MILLLFLLLFLISPSIEAGQVRFIPAQGNRVDDVTFDAARPNPTLPTHTTVLCSGATCGGAATITSPITWPVPPSAGWTSCAVGEPQWSRVVANNLVVRADITSTTGGLAVFRCRLVGSRADVLDLIRDLVREAAPNFRQSRLDTVIDIRQACPVANITQACITARELADALEPAALTTIMNEANTLINAKGY